MDFVLQQCMRGEKQRGKEDRTRERNRIDQTSNQNMRIKTCHDVVSNEM